MSKNFAIKGDVDRGNEVIKILEMLGGVNYACTGTIATAVYVIPNNGIIDNRLVHHVNHPEEYEIYTIDEFYQKYPYKVGDFVRIPEYESKVRINRMQWDGYEIQYEVYTDETEYFTAKELNDWNNKETYNKTDCEKCGLHFGSVQCFDKDCPNNAPKSNAVGLKDGKVIECGVNKKTNMNENKTDIKLKGRSIGDKRIIYQIPDGYEFEQISNNNEIIIKEKILIYPKTYKECCDILSIPPYYNLRYHTYEHGYNEYATLDKLISLQDKLNILGKVIICRDAYWKIAGKELGLDEIWKPDWNGFENGSYPTITKCNGRIVKTSIYTHDCILTFPTEEMRDAFYENFKELIEQCKELL